MSRRTLALAAALSTVAAGALVAAPVVAKWPPWISIEAPVNPFDPATRGAELLVHTHLRDGVAEVVDLGGTAEGLVDGARRSIPLRFDATSRPGVFALRRQWPANGSWLLRISLKTTTALVAIGADGQVAGVRVPTELRGGDPLPRAVGAREIDSTLLAMQRR
jgi:hypothetical protein